MRRDRRRSGFTLVELSLSVTIIVVSLLGTTAAIFAAFRLDATVRQRQEGHRALQSLGERVRATAFDDIAATWSDTSHDFVISGKHAAATLEVAELGSTTSDPMLQVTVRIADPGDATKTLMATTQYVSRDSSMSGN